MGRPHGHGIDHGQAPAVELEAEVALDPGKGVLLPDRDQDLVAREVDIGLARRHELASAFGVVLGPDLLEENAGQPARLVREFLGHEVVQDRDALVQRVLLLPGRRLHLVEAAAHDDLHVLATEPARGAAAVHRGVAAAEDEHAAADPVDMAERYARQPVDADVDAGRSLLRPGRARSRPRGAPLPTKTASYPSSSSALMLSIVRPSRSSGMRPRT